MVKAHGPEARLWLPVQGLMAVFPEVCLLAVKKIHLNIEYMSVSKYKEDRVTNNTWLRYL